MLDAKLRSKTEQALSPVGKMLARIGITANTLTVLGLAAAAGTAWVIANGYLRWAVLGIIITGVPDLLDGTVARSSGRAGPRGAFLDSVSDRISDALLFGGVAWYLAQRSPGLAILAMAVAMLSMLISYERSAAGNLGLQARGGLMERAERLVLLGVGLALHALVPVLWIMLVLVGFTAIHRFWKVWRQTSSQTPETSKWMTWWQEHTPTRSTRRSHKRTRTPSERTHP